MLLGFLVVAGWNAYNAASDNIVAEVKTVDAAINAEFLAVLSTIVAEQNKRLLQAKDSLPWIVWMGTVGGAIVVVTMSFILYMKSAWPHILMTSVTAMLIGMMIYMVFILEQPFEGPRALQPTAFEETPKVFSQIDEGD